MLLESFSQTILRWLRIPPGTSLRKYSKASNSSAESDISENDYISTIVDITVEDICIGEEPLSIDYDYNTPKSVSAKLDSIKDEFNSIVKWAAKDLCILGVSVYKVTVDKKKNKLYVLPSLDDYEFYLTSDKKVVAFNISEDKKSKTQEKDLLIFINTDKNHMNKVEDEEKKQFAFKLTPVPMQLKNANDIVQKIRATENAIVRYRAQISRYARWVNVDVGLSQGDQLSDTIDSISTAINANSMDLSMTSEATSFDDNLPVIPNRKGLGKPEIVENSPQVNIKDLADLDYWLSKLNLVMRFPATYMDFSKNLDSTAVSLIRGDIRYNKLCNSVKSKICSTLNDYIQESAKFKVYHPVFSLIQLPSTEDEDVVEALDRFVELTEKAVEFVCAEGLDGSSMLLRLTLVKDLVKASTNSPSLQSWFDDFEAAIKKSIPSEDAESPGSPSGGPSGSHIGGDLPDIDDIDESPEEGIDESTSEGGAEDITPPNDIEFLNGQS